MAALKSAWLACILALALLAGWGGNNGALSSAELADKQATQPPAKPAAFFIGLEKARQIEKENSLPLSRFYDTPDLPKGKPGDLIRTEECSDYRFPAELALEPSEIGIKVVRFLYLSKCATGQQVPASGVIVIPYGEPPPGGWLVTLATFAEKIPAGRVLKPDWANNRHFQKFRELSVLGERPTHGPILLLQGEADQSIPPRPTDALYERMKRQKSQVEYRKYPGLDHVPLVFGSFRDQVRWVQDRFAARPVSNNAVTPHGIAFAALIRNTGSQHTTQFKFGGLIIPNLAACSKLSENRDLRGEGK